MTKVCSLELQHYHFIEDKNMYKVKEVYGNKTVLKQFPKPDFGHIIDNKNIKDASWIDFDDIFIDDELGNTARLNGQSPGHVQDLKESFSNGVLINMPVGAVMRLPALDKNGKPHQYKWKLMYGYGRTLALDSLGVDGWAYNEIIASETEWEDIQSFENEDVAPKSTNKEDDIVYVKTKQIREGRLARDEDSVVANLKKTYPTRKKPSLDSIAAKIFANAGIVAKFAYYTESKIKLWRTNHYNGYFQMKGDWDLDRKSYGYTSVIGGVYRTWANSLQKYAETGNESYVIGFANTISKGSSLISQRQSIVREYVKLRVNHAIVYGRNIKFLTLLGFFPQEASVDDWTSLILLDQDEIELQVKQSLNAARLRIRQAQAA